MRLPLSDSSHLRTLEQSDTGELHALIEDNRAHLAPWMPWAGAQAQRDTAAFVRRAVEQRARNDGFQAAIVRGDEIAGVIGFHAIDWAHRSTSLGYWLAERHQGSGLMTDAARALVEHALGVWDLNRVEIRAAVDNRRSRRIPERLGFREEGVLRQAELVGGRFLDVAVYAMLATEWRARTSAG